ncbi:MAG: hypothetical protein U0003_01380 [Vampirovibrionales bacterium]
MKLIFIFSARLLIAHISQNEFMTTITSADLTTFAADLRKATKDFSEYYKASTLESRLSPTSKAKLGDILTHLYGKQADTNKDGKIDKADLWELANKEYKGDFMGLSNDGYVVSDDDLELMAQKADAAAKTITSGSSKTAPAPTNNTSTGYTAHFDATAKTLTFKDAAGTVVDAHMLDEQTKLTAMVKAMTSKTNGFTSRTEDYAKALGITRQEFNAYVVAADAKSNNPYKNNGLDLGDIAYALLELDELDGCNEGQLDTAKIKETLSKAAPKAEEPKAEDTKTEAPKTEDTKTETAKKGTGQKSKAKETPNDSKSAAPKPAPEVDASKDSQDVPANSEDTHTHQTPTTNASEEKRGVLGWIADNKWLVALGLGGLAAFFLLKNRRRQAPVPGLPMPPQPAPCPPAPCGPNLVHHPFPTKPLFGWW